MQVNKSDGCGKSEQQKQQKQQKQKQQKQQTQTGGGKNCVSSFSPDPASAASADGIEASDEPSRVPAEWVQLTTRG